MNTNEIREIFQTSIKIDGKLSVTDFIELSSKVPCKFDLDKNSLIYFYYINISDLVYADDDTIYLLASSGWTLSEDGKKIIKCC